MAKTMQVSLVAADREVRSREATVVNCRTLAGEIGIMADHTPVMSVLAGGQLDVRMAAREGVDGPRPRRRLGADRSGERCRSGSGCGRRPRSCSCSCCSL